MLLQELLQLNEIGDNTYSWEWKGDYKAIFDYGEEHPMEVTFKRMNGTAMEVMDMSFKSTGTDDYAAVDAKGKEIKIMSTVMAIGEDFYNRMKDSIDGISAEGAMDAPGKRNKMYLKYLKRLQKKFGGTISSTGRENIWVLPKDDTSNTDALMNFITPIIKDFISGKNDIDDIFDEPDYTEGDMTVTFEEANLFRGGIVEFNEDDSDVAYDSYTINIDIDKVADGDPDNELESSLIKMKNDISRLLDQIK